MKVNTQRRIIHIHASIWPKYFSCIILEERRHRVPPPSDTFPWLRVHAAFNGSISCYPLSVEQIYVKREVKRTSATFASCACTVGKPWQLKCNRVLGECPEGTHHFQGRWRRKCQPKTQQYIIFTGRGKCNVTSTPKGPRGSLPHANTAAVPS